MAVSVLAIQAGQSSEEKKKTKDELELRLKLLSGMEEKMEDDGERSLLTVCNPSPVWWCPPDPVNQGAVRLNDSINITLLLSLQGPCWIVWFGMTARHGGLRSILPRCTSQDLAKELWQTLCP